MVPRTVALIIMPVAMDMQQVEFVKQAVALEHFQGAIHGYPMNSRVNLLGALEDGIGGQVLLSLVHHFEQDPPLASQAHALALQRAAQTAWFGVGVETFA